MSVIAKDEAIRNVSANVKQLLLDAGWSIRELARRSENSPMLISNLTSGKHMPTGDALKRMAEALGVSLDSLFDGEPKRRKVSA